MSGRARAANFCAAARAEVDPWPANINNCATGGPAALTVGGGYTQMKTRDFQSLVSTIRLRPLRTPASV